jgi:Gene product 88
LGSVLRPLLVMGNDKLSASVFHFDLPAVRTCPGRSQLCSRICYAKKNRYRYPQVKERLNWAFEQSKRNDFADRMVDELYRKGVVLMRFHCSGDIYSPAYARKMLEVIGRSPHCTFWAYTRSWRVPAIFPILKAISMMPNMSLWFSVDAETDYPNEVPDGVRIAYMQAFEDDPSEDADLVFLNHPLRRRVPLGVLDRVCPSETPEGVRKGVTCATCAKCFR